MYFLEDGFLTGFGECLAAFWAFYMWMEAGCIHVTGGLMYPFLWRLAFFLFLEAVSLLLKADCLPVDGGCLPVGCWLLDGCLILKASCLLFAKGRMSALFL